MSFDVFITCFRNGKASGVPKSAIRKAFGSGIRDVPGLACWKASYSTGDPGTDVYFTLDESDASQITSLTLNRPVADRRLWESVLQIMQLGNFVLYFPDGACPLIASRETLHHLPADMVNTLGQPTLISNAQHIVDALEAA